MSSAVSVPRLLMLLFQQSAHSTCYPICQFSGTCLMCTTPVKISPSPTVPPPGLRAPWLKGIRVFHRLLGKDHHESHSAGVLTLAAPHTEAFIALSPLSRFSRVTRSHGYRNELKCSPKGLLSTSLSTIYWLLLGRTTYSRKRGALLLLYASAAFCASMQFVPTRPRPSLVLGVT